MKRFLTCLLTLTTLLALTAPALADILWEPSGNQFYNDHRNECEHEDRTYYANGRKGFVTLWDAPDGSMVQAQFENGEKLWAPYLYKDWALINYSRGHLETTGWVPMKDLELVYDGISFEEEYADRITPYNDEFADYDGELKRVNFYAYPGAPEIAEHILNGFSFDVTDDLTGAEDGRSCIRSIFVDEDGRTWGFVGYLYHRRGWFCLDEPGGADFPVRDVPQPSLIPAQEPVMPTTSYVPYILVAAVVAATGGILAVFYGKKRKSTD